MVVSILRNSVCELFGLFDLYDIGEAPALRDSSPNDFVDVNNANFLLEAHRAGDARGVVV